jgi:hypothetical protein
MRRRSMGWKVSLGLVVALLWAAGSAAMAQEAGSDDEARVHFRLGRAYYESGRFDEAAKEFEAAYHHSNRPQLLYNVFLAWRDAGRLRKAVASLEKFLELVPDAPERDALSARLVSMRRLAENEPEESEDGTVAPSRPTAEAAEGEGDAETAESAAEGVEPIVADVSEGKKRSPVPWIVMGSGAALMVGGAITGLLALKTKSDLDSACPEGGCPPGSGFESDVSRGKTLALMTDVLMITGAVALGTGVALLFLMKGNKKEQQTARRERPTASVGCGPHGCMGTLRVGF